MRRVATGLGSLVVAAGLTTTFALSAGAAPPDGAKVQPRQVVADDLPNAAEEKRRELREVAISKVLAGDAKVQQARRQRGRQRRPDEAAESAGRGPVRRARAREDGQDLRHPGRVRQRAAPELPGPGHGSEHPGPGAVDGPLHNEIPAPDRTKDNKTIWQPDYNRAHYQQLYFGTGADVNSVKTYYERQSSGRYSVDGLVTDWVKVPYNEARYGRSNGYPCPGNVCEQHAGS